MAEQNYGAVASEEEEEKKDVKAESKETDPLVQAADSSGAVSSRSAFSASRLPLVTGLNNPEFRAIVLGTLLFTFLIPSLITIAIKKSDDKCYEDYCKIWIAAYCFMLIGMFCYEFTFAYLWYHKFESNARRSLLVTMPRTVCAVMVSIGGILLLSAVVDKMSSRKDSTGYFGIYLIPILTAFAWSIDIFVPRFGDSVRVRCSVLSGIIAIASLLIVLQSFGEKYSWSSNTEAVYQFGWLMAFLSSLAIFVCCVSGLGEYLKAKDKSIFLALDYVAFCTLFTGISFTMGDKHGYIDETRMAFLVFAECAILCIEIFLL